jgi:triacylglycerol lipase
VLSSLSAARRRLVLALLAGGAAAVLVLGLVVLLGAREEPARAPGAADQAGPVLLVPGYGGSAASLADLAGSLRAAGKDVTLVALPGGGVGDLRLQARALERAARDATARTGAPSVDVVGYSAGGVVARVWVRDYGGQALARRVLTLGSPHHGTELADLGSLVAGECPAACQQLGSRSGLLASLNASPSATGPRFVSIWTTADDVVLPPDSSRLPGALNLPVQGVCRSSRVRHAGLPGDPVVQAMVAAELAPGPPRALGESDCARLSS